MIRHSTSASRIYPRGSDPVHVKGAVVVADADVTGRRARVIRRAAALTRTGLGTSVFRATDTGSRRRSPSGERDRGQSLMLVVVLMAALLLLPAAITAMAIGDINQASNANPQNSALAAAYAGLSDYVSALNTNASFPYYNANNSGAGQTGASPAFGGNGCSSSCSAATGMWEPVFDTYTAGVATGSTSTNQCYFYETNSNSGTIVVTVTGRSGPSNIAYTAVNQPGGKTAPYCTTVASAHYRYQTVAAQFANTPPTTSGYMYTNEYNVPSPVDYGLFSGGLATCGYYAYSTNPNWTFGWIGTQATVEVYALWVGGYLFNSGWDFFEGPAGWNGSPGGAFGPSQGGALGSTEVYTYGTGSSPGYGDPGSNVGSGGAGALINGNGAARNNAYGAAFLSSVTDGYGWWSNDGGNAVAYSDGNHNGTPNFSINGYPTNIGSQTTGQPGGPGTNNYDAAWSTSGTPGSAAVNTDQPTGCGIVGAPYHDGFWTSFDTFNGNPGNANPSGQNGLTYTSDQYYVCGTTNAGSNLGYGPTINNVNLISGDPYSANAEQVNNENNPGPALFNWNFNWGVVAMTVFYIGFDPVAESYAAYPANAGPPEPYQPGAGASDSYVAAGITGNIQMYIFKGQFFGFSFDQNPVNLGAAVPICNQPDNWPNGQGGGTTISNAWTYSGLNAQIVPPYDAPDNTYDGVPDYGLGKIQNDATGISGGGCIYRGNTEFTFTAGGGATVATGGSIMVSGQSVTLGTVTTFGGNDGFAGSGPMNGCAGAGSVTPPNHLFLVVDGNAYVQGTVFGNYTVAVTDPCALSPTTPHFNYCSSRDSQVQLLPGTNGTDNLCTNGVNDPGANYGGNPYACFSKYGGYFVAIQPSFQTWRTGASGYGAANGAVTGGSSNGTYSESYAYTDTFYDSIYVIGDIKYAATDPKGDACAASPPFGASCQNYLGLLSQNNVVIAYPLACAGLGGASCNYGYYTESGNDTDATYTLGPSNGYTTNSDLTDNDSGHGDFQCQPDNSCAWAADSSDGDGYWQCDNWNCGGYYGFFGPSDPGDGDDVGYCAVPDWWGCTISASAEGGTGHGGSDSDKGWCTWGGGHCNAAYDTAQTAGQGDWNFDADGDPGSIGPVNCVSNPYGDDNATPSCDWSETSLSNDGDDTAVTAASNEPKDGGTTVRTIDADIEAVWGTLLLDDYGYWSNPDHSCYVAYFANILGNAYDALSDDSHNAAGTTTSGPGGCSSDNDGDESTIGSLTINGSINEFWQGILTHYEAYSGSFAAQGGYSSVTTNYDGRFQNALPVYMNGPGNPTWNRQKIEQLSPICPTGQIAGSGNSAAEVTTPCP